MALYQKSKPQQMDDSEKIYYSIGEVAESLHVDSSLLRHWESEYPSIQPKKNRQGGRK